MVLFQMDIQKNYQDQNNNSSELITLVMRDICRQGGLGTVRKWIQIGFDGVPYCIAYNIKEKLLQCLKCNVEIDEANTSLAFHLSQKHRVTDKSSLRGEKVFQDPSLRGEKVFKDFPLVPGAGQMKKILLLAMFSLCQNIFLEHLPDLLRYRTKFTRIYNKLWKP